MLLRENRPKGMLEEKSDHGWKETTLFPESSWKCFPEVLYSFRINCDCAIFLAGNYSVQSLACYGSVYVLAGVQAWFVHMCPPTHRVKIISLCKVDFLSYSLLFRN